MSMQDVKDQTAIVGVGQCKFDRNPERIELGSLVAALKNALDDAGLRPDDLDGIITQVVPPEAAMDKLPETVGLKNVRYAFQSWYHGRMNATVYSMAALAVYAGMANYIACFSSTYATRPKANVREGRTVTDPEATREGGGPHLEAPPYGAVGPTGGAALAMRKYMLKYGYTSEDLGIVSVAQRQWAALNPEAFLRDRPLTIEDYLNSRYIVEPLRLPDMGMPVNAATCIIITTIERARDCRKRPIRISGMQASTSGRENFVFGRTNLGVGQQPDIPYNAPKDLVVYRMAELTPKDVEILGIFDTTSPIIPFALEEFGFCQEGEALGWMQGGRTAPGGQLPVNTHGGSLSAGMSGGSGSTVELVRQLRGEAGARQVQGVEIGQYLMVDRSSVILRK